MKSLLLGLVLAMSAVLPAAAESWEQITTGDNGAIILSLDVDSVSPFSKGYSYTERVVDRNKNKIFIYYAGIMCRERLVKTIGHDTYNFNGELIESKQTLEYEFEPILVDSFAGALWQRLCN